MGTGRCPARHGYSQAPGSGGPDRHSTWLSTINPDGSPHLSGLGSVWLRDQFWFETGRTSRKGRNLERDPRCALSLALPDFDLTINGRAELITDPELVAELAAVWAADGWPAEPDQSGTAITAPFSAPSAGNPPWHLYRITSPLQSRSALSNPAAPPDGFGTDLERRLVLP